jgi:predicted helicase
MLSLCTGAGKTMTSCQIFANIQVKPVVFIVPAIELLNQTQREFEKYLRLENSSVKVGIAGGGKCDINFDGINVITYQTALIAFNKKYLESSKKIVNDDNGDGQSKSTQQLQKEFDEAEIIYKSALNQAKKKLPENSSERTINSLIKVELAAYKKTLTALQRRQEIINQKSQVRKLIETCSAFIIDEAQLAA